MMFFCTFPKDKKSYTFRSFWDRDECHRMLNLFLTRFRAKEPLKSADSGAASRRASATLAPLVDPNEAKLFGAAPLPTGESRSSKKEGSSADEDQESEPVVRDRRGSARILMTQSPPSTSDKDAKRLSQRPLPSEPASTTSAESSGRRASRIMDPSAVNTEDVMDYGEDCVIFECDSACE